LSAVSASVLGCSGLSLTPAERAFFAGAAPWGFILFGRNVADPDQLKRLTGELRDAVGRDAPILIDQEGGRVQRMWPPYWRQWQPPLDQMRRAGSLEAAARVMFLRHRLIAAELLAVGIDVDCVPTADVARPETHPFLRNRCFGEDVASVVTGARAASEGLMAGGVLPVMKHLPGHGRARIDSHKDLPVVDASAEDLRQTDFAPFKALSDLPMAMTAHIRFTAFDGDRPATQSPTMIALIREEIGFDGLLLSDDLGMEALSGTVPERAAAARAAGCDIALHCNGDLADMEASVAAVGGLTGPAAARADHVLALPRTALPLDIDAAEQELNELLDGEVYG
jgi:beta-N-acetylhexosaminidase